MLEIAITRIVAFAVGYGVREWAYLTAQDKGDAGLSEKCTHGLVDGLTAVWN
jgi:hypothetical protein